MTSATCGINRVGYFYIMQVGIDSFAAQFGKTIGREGNDALAMAQLLERIEHAEKVGLDVFGIGEHHRKEFLDYASAV